MKSPLALTFALVLLTSAASALACESAGPNTHIGVVTAIDTTAQTLTLKDAESGMTLTFRASPEQLQGLAVQDLVTVTYTEEGKALRARTVRKG